MNGVADSAMVTAIVVAGITGAIVAFGVYLWYAFALSRLFPRLGVAGWKGWVPILNEATILTLGGKPAWGVVFYFIPIAQLYGLYLKIVATHRINQRFGRGAGSTALAVLLPPVWATLLAGGAPPYPEGDRLAGLPGLPRQHQPGQGADAAHRSSYLAPPILPPGVPQPRGAGGAPPSYAAASPASFPPMPPASVMPGAPMPPEQQTAPASFAPAAEAPAASSPPPPPPPAAFVPEPAGQLIDSVPGIGTRAPAVEVAPSVEPAAPVTPAAAAPPVAEPVAPVEPAAPAAQPADRFAPPAASLVPQQRPASDAGRERVPGIRPAPVPLPMPAEPAPSAAPAASTASVATPAPSGLEAGLEATLLSARAADEDDLEATVVVPRRRGVRRVLVLDDGRRFALSATSIVIGRNPEGDAGEQRLSIPDKTRTLSKTHARLVVQGDEWRLTDLDSTNGVVVVADDGAETLLDPGESVIGAGRFVLGEVGMHVAVESDS